MRSTRRLAVAVMVVALMIPSSGGAAQQAVTMRVPTDWLALDEPSSGTGRDRSAR